MYILTIALAFVCIVLTAVLIETKRKLRISEMLKDSTIRSDNHNGTAVDRLNTQLQDVANRTHLRMVDIDTNNFMQVTAVMAISAQATFESGVVDKISMVSSKDVTKFIASMMMDIVYIKYGSNNLSKQETQNFRIIAFMHTKLFIKYFNNELNDIFDEQKIKDITFTHFNGSEYSFDLKYKQIYNKMRRELLVLRILD